MGCYLSHCSRSRIRDLDPSGGGTSPQRPAPPGLHPPALFYVPKVLQPSNIALPSGTECSGTTDCGDIAESTQARAASLLQLPSTPLLQNEVVVFLRPPGPYWSLLHHLFHCGNWGLTLAVPDTGKERSRGPTGKPHASFAQMPSN